MPLKYHVFENMENGEFAPLEESSIFHNIFISIQNLTYFFFQCCLKIENDVMI